MNIHELMKDYTKNFFHILSLRYTARVKASRISFILLAGWEAFSVVTEISLNAIGGCPIAAKASRLPQ